MIHGQACERKQAGHHPNCEGITAIPGFAVARKGRAPWLEMNMPREIFEAQVGPWQTPVQPVSRILNTAQ